MKMVKKDAKEKELVALFLLERF